MQDHSVSIRTAYITLDAFLKWVGVAETGGHAKVLIASGEVLVNDQSELRRGRKLRPGDYVTVSQVGRWTIALQEEE